MPPVLRLYEDVLSSDSAEISLPALPRMIFVVHGAVAIADRTLRDGEAWTGEGAVAPKADRQGATLWRWEMAAGDAAAGVISARGVVSREKLIASLETLPKGPLLLRGDSVAFPAGGCAYLHRHQGARHSLFVGRRNPYRYPWTFDLVWARLRLVRNRAGRCVRAGRRPANALHPRHGAAARLSGQKLGRVFERRRQGEAEVAAVQNFRRHAAQFAAVLRSGLQVVRNLAAILGELGHNLTMQPDIHRRRVVRVAGVVQFLG